MILDTTPRGDETSEEFDTTILVFNGGEGKLYFQDENGQDLVVKYSYYGAGSGKGAVYNIAESLKTDDSGGLGKVNVRHGYYFGPEPFLVWVG